MHQTGEPSRALKKRALQTQFKGTYTCMISDLRGIGAATSPGATLKRRSFEKPGPSYKPNLLNQPPSLVHSFGLKCLYLNA
jgi:hypothetical protein